jgi:phenylpyruvate tautomerase
MPVLKIQTNRVPSESHSDALIQRATCALSRALGKSERTIMVFVEENPRMAFGGSRKPLAYLELKSLGLPVDSIPDLSRELCELVARGLCIAQNRIYIEFSAAERTHWGWNGKTLA